MPVAATNYLNVGAGARATPPVGFTDPQFYAIIKHIRIVNKTGVSCTVNLYKGLTAGTAAGTEIVIAGGAIAANSFIDWYGIMRFDTADFLSGTCQTVTSLVFQAEGELGAAG